MYGISKSLIKISDIFSFKYPLTNTLRLAVKPICAFSFARKATNDREMAYSKMTIYNLWHLKTVFCTKKVAISNNACAFTLWLWGGFSNSASPCNKVFSIGFDDSMIRSDVYMLMNYLYESNCCLAP